MINILSFIFFILISFPAFAEEPTVFQMPKNENIYFKSYSYTFSEYFQFNANGTYRKITREHMYVDESDHGTWRQDKSGELILTSQEHYRNIECASLCIGIWNAEGIKRLPLVKEYIKKLLDNSNVQAFTKEQIEARKLYGKKHINKMLLAKFNEQELTKELIDEIENTDFEHSNPPLIYVDYRVEIVPRSDLNDLIKQIDEFLNDSEKKDFHATPMNYKGQTFLLWKNAQTCSKQDLKETLAEIDKHNSETTLTHIYTKIKGDIFQKESETTQEFIFYPEMNTCIPQPEKRE